MPEKKLLIASSHQNEAITKWILENKTTDTSVEVIFIDRLLTEFSIRDELNDSAAIIKWERGGITEYSNQTHNLLNRVIHIDGNLFKTFHADDREYAKREFEAYLGYSLNAFQSPQNQAINGICERIQSLPQQWQLVQKQTNLLVPEYCWGSKYLNIFSKSNCSPLPKIG